MPSFPTISAILATVFLVPSSFRSAQTTFAPSLANKTAVSKPIPLISYQFMKKIIQTSNYLAAPVTIATFPERRCPVIVYVFIKESKKRGEKKMSQLVRKFKGVCITIYFKLLRHCRFSVSNRTKV